MFDYRGNFLSSVKKLLQTLKIVQERARNTMEAIGIGKDFLNRT
jgi:hypothetical protein